MYELWTNYLTINTNILQIIENILLNVNKYSAGILRGIKNTARPSIMLLRSLLSYLLIYLSSLYHYRED